MKLEQLRQGVYRMTVHALELSSLIAAARLVKDSEGEIPDEARENLKDLLDAYDRELAALHQDPARSDS